MEKLKTRWFEYRSNVLSNQAVLGRISNYEKEMGEVDAINRQTPTFGTPLLRRSLVAVVKKDKEDTARKLARGSYFY